MELEFTTGVQCVVSVLRFFLLFGRLRLGPLHIFGCFQGRCTKAHGIALNKLELKMHSQRCGEQPGLPRSSTLLLL